ncbi:cell division protein FtsY [Hyphomicrobium nitrativorans NL23]|uniref:Signal recognition particle receptor FtsY n=1 Tax=Hyphomicrobium nitrativorans NL23 TaxID=1029756 RepID=V5SAI5_9HYPH|nr:signal recognition particle-docking protein FtsY [Hyphomicrobium nitrativorans]AHB47452.1 cell division protein FtsY [Hyphomicrobium nitrativorans NL23]
MTADTPKRKGFLSRWLGTAEEPEAPAEETASDIATPESDFANPAPPPPQDQSETPAPAGTATPSQPEVTELDASAEPEPAAEPARVGWFGRLKAGLSKTSSRLTESIAGLVTKKKLDHETLEDLEDVLIGADLGIETASRITAALAKGRFDKAVSPEEVRAVLADEVARVLEPVAQPLVIDDSLKPHVILVLGVNGSGKTTTIGKLAARFTREGRRVMLAAGDTFRAAAIDQLKVWGERTGAPVVSRDLGADASGLAFDALKEAKEGGYDVLLLDTAGRLQNKEGLMAELEKVVRVIKKLDPDAPHSTLLVLDATTGQNALQQVDVFGKRAGVSGLVMTKLDGTARGGILVAIAAKYGLPVHAIGVGEGIDDLQAFSAGDYARAIAEI